MSILILYYSGTGNTRFACEVTRLALARVGREATMVRYERAAAADLAGRDGYCFASPVYEWAPARNVERFIAGMERLDGKCAFIVTTSAGAKGQATNLFARMLRGKGLTVLGDHNLLCPDSWGGSRRWSHDQDADTPTVQSVRELAAFGERMAGDVRSFVDGESLTTPDYRVKPTGLYLASRLARLAPSARVKMGAKKVDPESCDQCAVCERNCPVGAIALGPYPAFGSACIGCWRCINTCPKDSIGTIIDSGHHYKGIPHKSELLEEAGLLDVGESPPET